MKKIAQNTLQDLSNILDQAKAKDLTNIKIPIEIQNGDPQLKMQYLMDLGVKSEDAKKYFDEFDVMVDKNKMQEQQRQVQRQKINTTTNTTGPGSTSNNVNTANSKPFNLKKAQLELQTNFAPENIEKGFSDKQFNSIVDLVKFLDSSDESNARLELLEFSGQENEELIASILKQYYETDWQNMDDIETQKIMLVKPVWDSLVPAVKSETAQQNVLEDATYKSVTAFVNDVNKTIKKLAQDSVKSNSFNLKKFAQAKTIENVIMWGPTEKRFDPFLRQPVSDWHIVERNKGFGLVVDDVFNIDWEAVWRGNIMDKYSSPYRDTKTGEWIGGYLQKRFEIDQWIPENNNYQLKPGELRRPYLPEQKGMEARLEAMREKQDRGYGPDSKGEPYDWNAKPEYANTKVASSLEESKVANSLENTNVKKAFNLSTLKKKVH